MGQIKGFIIGVYKNTKYKKTFVNKACETSRRKPREKKVTKKREPTADFVQLYIFTAVYVYFVYVYKEQYNIIIQNHL